MSLPEVVQPALPTIATGDPTRDDLLRTLTGALAERLGPTLSTSPIDPTTRLGDWYANLVHVGRLQLVLGVSERTLLPVG